MYDVLDLYEEKYDPKRSIVNCDEKPKQLLKDKRRAITMKPGSPEKYDYEYIRNGTATIFMATEFKAGKRVTWVSERRTMHDFASFVICLLTKSTMRLMSSVWLQTISTPTKTRHSMKRSARMKQKES